MKFNEYQEQAFLTALPTAQNFTYMVSGLASEAGEVAGKFKKFVRGDTDPEVFKASITKELGDVLWYVAGLATLSGTSLEDIARENIEKLTKRKLEGKLHGYGDNR
jgi:NTP pyrophosphatase (non-canonical NTP hydrolase)